MLVLAIVLVFIMYTIKTHVVKDEESEGILTINLSFLC